MTILNDQAFVDKGARIDLGSGIHTQRLTALAMRIADVPVLDGIVLSHAHPHQSAEVARRLDRRFAPFLVPRCCPGIRSDRPVTGVRSHARQGLCSRSTRLGNAIARGTVETQSPTTMVLVESADSGMPATDLE